MPRPCHPQACVNLSKHSRPQLPKSSPPGHASAIAGDRLMFQGVVAYVLCADAVHNAKAAIQARLSQNGAKIASRLSKDVTHVIFERGRGWEPQTARQGLDQDIRDLYARLSKVAYSLEGIDLGCYAENLLNGTRTRVAQPIIFTGTVSHSAHGGEPAMGGGLVVQPAAREGGPLRHRQAEGVSPGFQQDASVRVGYAVLQSKVHCRRRNSVCETGHGATGSSFPPLLSSQAPSGLGGPAAPARLFGHGRGDPEQLAEDAAGD